MNVDEGAEFSRSLGSQLLVVLQPALFEKTSRTETEDKLLAGALSVHASADALPDSYGTIRAGLNQRARNGAILFLDCSRIFNSEAATTFSDMWHFSDFGHNILASMMIQPIAAILNPQRPPKALRDRKPEKR